MYTKEESKAMFILTKSEGYWFDMDIFKQLRNRAFNSKNIEDKFALQGYLMNCRDLIDSLYQASREL